MNLRETNKLLSETVEELNEQAMYAMVDGRDQFIGLEPDEDVLFKKYPIWSHENWGVYKLKGVPKKLLDKVKRQAMKPATAWHALKKYVSGVSSFGDGHKDEKDLMKYQGVR